MKENHLKDKNWFDVWTPPFKINAEKQRLYDSKGVSVGRFRPSSGNTNYIEDFEKAINGADEVIFDKNNFDFSSNNKAVVYVRGNRILFQIRNWYLITGLQKGEEITDEDMAIYRLRHEKFCCLLATELANRLSKCCK